MNDTATHEILASFADKRRVYENCIKSGAPVVSWDDFEAGARDMIAASAELKAAQTDASELLQKVVGDSLRYPAWHLSHPEGLPIYELLTTDRGPSSVCGLHPHDFRFHLAYGKSKKNPLGHMAKRAAEIRKSAAKIRKGIQAHAHLAVTPTTPNEAAGAITLRLRAEGGRS